MFLLKYIGGTDVTNGVGQVGLLQAIKSCFCDDY